MAFEKPTQTPYQVDGDRTMGAMLDWLTDPAVKNSLAMAVKELHYFLVELMGQVDGVFATATSGVDVGKVTPTASPSMKVRIAEFFGACSRLPFRVTPGITTADFVEPASGMLRIDTVLANGKTRAFQILTGVEDATTPVAPSITSSEGHVLLAWVHLADGMTAIYDSETSGEGWIEDKRTPMNF